MDDTPFVNDGADTSLRKAVSLLNKIEAKTGSTTITGPVTVNNEVEIKNGENAPIPVSGTVTANTGLTQPLTDAQLRATAVPVNESLIVNQGSLFLYSSVGTYGTFDCGADADYVVFNRTGGGGGFTQKLEFSTTSDFATAYDTLSGSFAIFAEKHITNTGDLVSQEPTNALLSSNDTGSFVVNLRRLSTYGGNENLKVRYVRVVVSGGGGGGFAGKFTSFRSKTSDAFNMHAAPHKTLISGIVDINSAKRPLPVTDNGGSLTVDGTVELGSTSLAALENISVTFPATQNVNVTNAGLNVSVSNLPATQPVSGTFWPTTQPISGSVSVSNLPATQPVSGTIGTFNSSLVNAGSPFSYYGAGVYGTFDAGVDADYVEFSLDGGGGGFTHNLSLSTSNSPFYASNSTAAGLIVFNDKFPNSSLDTTAYRFSNTALNAGSTGTYVLSLRNGDIKHRYVRVEITGGGGGGWSGRFDSYKSLGLVSRVSAQSRIENRVPIAGVVDINSCTRELPVNDSALISSVGTTSEAAAISDLAVSSISGLFRRLLQRLTTLLPANLTVSSTRLLVDGSGVTQPVSLASVPSHAVTGSGSFTAAQATAANLNATVVGSGSFTAAQATASNLKTQAQILDSAGSLLTYAATGTAGTPGVDVVSIQGVSSGVAVAVSGPVTDTQLRASSIPVSDRGSVGQATVTTFTSTSSLVLMASNSARKLLTVFNEGAGILYLLYGAGTATTANYSVRIGSGDYLEIEKYTGAVTGIFGTTGTARVTEIS